MSGFGSTLKVRCCGWPGGVVGNACVVHKSTGRGRRSELGNLLRAHGSHHVYGKTGSIVRLSVPIHGNTPLKMGLLKHLMKMAPKTIFSDSALRPIWLPGYLIERGASAPGISDEPFTTKGCQVPVRGPMQTECSAGQLAFEAFDGRRVVTAFGGGVVTAFGGGAVTSDAVMVLLGSGRSRPA